MRGRGYYEQKHRKRKRRMQHMKMFMIGIAVFILVLLIYIIVTLFSLIEKTIEYKENESDQVAVWQEEMDEAIDGEKNAEPESEPIRSEREMIMDKLEDFAESHDFSVSEYPEEFIELLEKNPETEEFVLNYPLQKGQYSKEDLDEYLNHLEVPLLLQWDSRWGYYEYGGDPMGITGCGPTCLSMVSLHLLQNPQLTPVYIAEYAQQNGYYVDGTGSSWSLMSQGAAAFGLKAQEVPLDEELVLWHLQQGHPIICVMGPGDFTDSGHFVVFVGVEDGKIKINDPNSEERSQILWEFEDIKYQIKNMWAYSIR